VSADDQSDASAPTTRLSDLEAWARRRNPGTAFRLRGVAPSAIAPLIEQFDRLARIYPEVAARISQVVTGDLPTATRRGQPTTWARAAMPPSSPVPEIRLNSRAFDRAARVREYRAEMVYRRWHPSGTSEPSALMTHEFAHHLMFWLQDQGVEVRGFVQSLGDSQTLSAYARLNFGEAFAEAVTAQFHGDDASRNHPVTCAVAEMISQEMARIRADRSRE